MKKSHQPGCPCCGGAVVECDECGGTEVAEEVRLTISGFTNDNPSGLCTDTHDCPAIDGTYILDFLTDAGVFCIWRLILDTPIVYCKNGLTITVTNMLVSAGGIGGDTVQAAFGDGTGGSFEYFDNGISPINCVSGEYTIPIFSNPDDICSMAATVDVEFLS